MIRALRHLLIQRSKRAAHHKGSRILPMDPQEEASLERLRQMRAGSSPQSPEDRQRALHGQRINTGFWLAVIALILIATFIIGAFGLEALVSQGGGDR